MAAYLGLMSRRLTSLTLAIAFVVTSVVGWANPVQAQAGLAPLQPLTTLNTVLQPTTPEGPTLTPFSTPCDIAGCLNNSVNLSFGVEGNRVLQSFEVAGLPPLVRATGLTERVEFVRNPNLLIEGSASREVLFYESTSIVGANPPTAINLTAERVVDIPTTFLSPVVNRGIDNVFNNVTGGNQDTRTNIERIDYVLTRGEVVPPEFQGQEGFIVLERGGNDTFQIAAITGLDGNGVPATYGPLVRVGVANWGTANQVQIPTVVFRRNSDNPADPFLPSHTVGVQPVRGIFFPITSLLPPGQRDGPIFGYSLVAADVAPGTDLTQPQNFPPNTDGNVNGGLDLVAGGFGFFRAPRPPDPPLPPDPPPTPGNLFLNKRITQLITGGTVNPLNGIENPGDNAGFPALVTAGLGQGSINVADPRLQPGDEIEYSLYFNNTGGTEVTNVQVCDQIPLGTSFSPDGYGPGQGMLAIAPTAPAVPPATYTLVPYTNAGGDDPGTQLLPGATLPAVCGTPNLGNGAVAINVGTVGAGQVGLVRFKTRVNPPLPVTTPAP